MNPIAQDVPILRRRLVEWCDEKGAAFYHHRHRGRALPVAVSGGPNGDTRCGT